MQATQRWWVIIIIASCRVTQNTKPTVIRQGFFKINNWNDVFLASAAATAYNIQSKLICSTNSGINCK